MRPSAHKHHVADVDMIHAIEHCVVWVELDDDPGRFLVIGPDRAGNLLEVVTVALEDRALLIHAMPLRRSTAEAIFGGDE